MEFEKPIPHQMTLAGHLSTPLKLHNDKKLVMCTGSKLPALHPRALDKNHFSKDWTWNPNISPAFYR